MSIDHCKMNKSTKYMFLQWCNKLSPCQISQWVNFRVKTIEIERLDQYIFIINKKQPHFFTINMNRKNIVIIYYSISISI